MSKTAGVALCLSLLAAVPALAQAPTNAAPPPPPDQSVPDEPPGHEHAVVGGKKLQPHQAPGLTGHSPEEQIKLLQRNRTGAANEPIVVPHDIYGNPLGGSPGANPPGLEPSPGSTPPVPPQAARP